MAGTNEADRTLSSSVTDSRSATSVHPTNAFVRFEKGDIEQSIPDRFEQEVAAHPDRLAVRSRNHELTYGALNEAANRVAHAILAQRGPTEEPIALLLEPDAPMLSAMVGALKAGKIYVPLDRSHPTARRQHILKDSQATLIITDHRNRTSAREMALGRFPLIDVDDLDARYVSENPRLSLSPDTRAWILYTSGSTGQPKGVVQTHRNVLHFIRTYTNSLHICADDRLSLVYSFCTNAAAHEVYTALLNGASLFPLNIKEEGVARLPDWLVQHEITIFSAVPTVFRHLRKSMTGNAVFPHLRLIKLLGEMVYKQDVEFYKEYFSQDCILVNRLGSTETGTIRWYFIDKNTHITGSSVPVGYAIEDNEILLIGETSEEGGASRVGEIAVKSRYLSPGYWRRPDLTQAAFLPDPHGGDERIYRTGDLGRMLPDGCLVHLGRKDFQVKIKGHRIEAGEVEMALAALPAVKEAAVVAAKDRSGDQRLVAYVVPEGETAPTVTALRRALAVMLPEYMIPSVFVTLDSLPKAPNGKVSVGALPASGRARPELDNPLMPPRTPVEGIVCAIWAAVLELDEVGIHDDFLALGGHSLAASQVVARVAEAFHVDLPLSTLFDTPTVDGVAAAIAVSLARSQEREVRERLLTEIEELLDAEAEQLLTFPKPETREHARE
jgi:amino acid adenylation domain-containing protein